MPQWAWTVLFHKLWWFELGPLWRRETQIFTHCIFSHRVSHTLFINGSKQDSALSSLLHDSQSFLVFATAISCIVFSLFLRRLRPSWVHDSSVCLSSASPNVSGKGTAKSWPLFQPFEHAATTFCSPPHSTMHWEIQLKYEQRILRNYNEARSDKADRKSKQQRQPRDLDQKK